MELVFLGPCDCPASNLVKGEQIISCWTGLLEGPFPSGELVATQPSLKRGRSKACSLLL